MDYFCPKYQLRIYFDKNGLGSILGDLFTHSSGTDVMILKIFSQIFVQKIGVLDSKQRQIMQNLDHNIGF
jgi:hypothetical protein